MNASCFKLPIQKSQVHGPLAYSMGHGFQSYDLVKSQWPEYQGP